MSALLLYPHYLVFTSVHSWDDVNFEVMRHMDAAFHSAQTGRRTWPSTTAGWTFETKIQWFIGDLSVYHMSLQKSCDFPDFLRWNGPSLNETWPFGSHLGKHIPCRQIRALVLWWGSWNISLQYWWNPPFKPQANPYKFYEFSVILYINVHI